MISVLDYGVGNLGSIVNMLRRIDAEVRLVTEPAALLEATKILLPGVGSYDNGMRRLRESGLVEPLRARVEAGTPILGICLGMQMLVTGSEEGDEPGLGFIRAQCRRFRFPDRPQLKVPHMGWNIIQPCIEAPLIAGLPGEPRYYFVHSYHVVCEDNRDVLATADYGGNFVAMIQRDNVMGAQFHPEKSHRFGMALLKNFSNL